MMILNTKWWSLTQKDVHYLHKMMIIIYTKWWFLTQNDDPYWLYVIIYTKCCQPSLSPPLPSAGQAHDHLDAANSQRGCLMLSGHCHCHCHCQTIDPSHHPYHLLRWPIAIDSEVPIFKSSYSLLIIDIAPHLEASHIL